MTMPPPIAIWKNTSLPRNAAGASSATSTGRSGGSANRDAQDHAARGVWAGRCERAATAPTTNVTAMRTGVPLRPRLDEPAADQRADDRAEQDAGGDARSPPSSIPSSSLIRNSAPGMMPVS
jgi:hypothetical protein